MARGVGRRGRRGVRRRNALEVTTVLNAVRRISKATKPYVLKTGGDGVVIEEVQPDSPAEKAGLKPSDVIVEFGGEHVRSARQFGRLVQETPAGRAVKATITHDGHTYDVDRPEVVPFADAAGLYSDRDRRSLEQFRVEECLRLRKAVVLTS